MLYLLLAGIFLTPSELRAVEFACAFEVPESREWEIFDSLAYRDGVLVAAAEGLFRFDKRGKILVVAGSEQSGGFYNLWEFEGEVLAYGDKGLFRLTASEEVVKISDLAGAGRIEMFVRHEDGLRFLSEFGLFIVTLDGAIEKIDDANYVKEIKALPFDHSDRMHVGTSTHLRGGELKELPPGTDIGYLYGRYNFGGDRLYLSAEGLYRLTPEGWLERIVNGDVVGWRSHLVPFDKMLFFTSQRGLIHLYQPFPLTASMPDMRTETRSTEDLNFEWKLSNACHKSLPKKGLFRIVINGQPSNTLPIVKVADSSDPDDFRVEGSLPIDGGDQAVIHAHLEVRSSPKLSNWTKVIGSDVEIKVNWGLVDYFEAFAPLIASGIFVAHALLFILAIAAAHWSATAWAVISDPFWGKFGLWFRFLLRHFRPIQRWVLALWFVSVRSENREGTYLSLPINGPGDTHSESVELLSLFSPGCRVWLQGRAGMGKTALVEELCHRYFNQPHSQSISEVYRNRGYLLLKISLRTYGDLRVPSENPEEWLFEMAGRSMASSGMLVEDKSLVKSFISSGNFVLILDGTNEVDDKGAIEQFARRYPKVGLFVTSQNMPIKMDQLFEIWSLPPDMSSAMPELLTLYLGDAAGAVLEEFNESGISREVLTGYDVSLIVDLAKSGLNLPSTRLGLYDSMLEKASMGDGARYDVPGLCQVAWESWKSRGTDRNRLVCGDNISESLLQPLLTGDANIITTGDGGKSYQFRHDLMRAYLAASWVALHQVSPLHLIESDLEIFQISKTEQGVVWGFLAELISEEHGTSMLNWASLEEDRSVLQVALRRVAQKNGW